MRSDNYITSVIAVIVMLMVVGFVIEAVNRTPPKQHIEGWVEINNPSPYSLYVLQRDGHVIYLTNKGAVAVAYTEKEQK